MNYQQAALKTCPDGYHPNVPAGLMMRVMMDYVNASNALDAIKKAYAYGRDLPAGLKPVADANADVQFKGEIDGDVLHAVLGVATEGGELVEAAMKSLFNGEQFDIVNFQEELGDVAWYRAIGLAAVGQTIAENDTQNIEKLAKRFNDGRFDADLANNRDTDAERVVLEGYDAELHNARVFMYGPERTRLQGHIHKDRAGRFPDGTFVTTTEVMTEEGDIFTTHSGTRYKLVGDYTDERSA